MPSEDTSRARPIADEYVDVTAADREAYLSMNTVPASERTDIRAGAWDRTTGIQAFARHRIACVFAATCPTHTVTDMGVDHLMSAAQALIDKILLIHNDSHYQSVWIVHQLHAGPYIGPDYAAELEGLRSTLAAIATPR